MKQLLNTGQLSVHLQAGTAETPLEVTLSERRENEVVFIDFTITSTEAVTFPEAVLDVHFPFVNMHSCWTPCPNGNPKSIRNKGIPEWWPHYDSLISKAAPVGSFYSQDGENRLSYALSDANESVKIHAGAYEEERVGRIRMRLFSSPSVQRTEYKGTLRLDLRAVPYYEAIEDMSSWYEQLFNNQQMAVPQAALEPAYSSWYSFHQNLSQQEIEDQCRLSSEIGCKTIILDDGWQTDDNNRGYKFCGDWQVAESRFPDMRGHVERVQAMGMKYILWLSVPFIGKGSRIWDEFKDNLLFYTEEHECGTLDPRYPEARRYLIDTYRRVVADYNLDGLKLDFIDEFNMSMAEGTALSPDPARDTESLPQAVDLLMMGIRESLTRINPEIMIEFRQTYIGPMIRKYGNIFRVHDCPNDSIMNRMSIMDLRMFSGNTAVHSDMFIWSNEDSAESASLHFINTLFSVPQLSLDMKELSSEHLHMSRHWLGFWRNNRDLLLKGKLKSSYPEMQYPLIESQLGNRKVVTVHARMVSEIFNSDEQEVILINGAMENSLFVKLPQAVSAGALTYDCLGNMVREQALNLDKGLNEIEMPKSGYIVLRK
ncbi:glycoside hydrolase family 36 protein [Psychromonas ossibalaenae]|uniref:glycoside hydrolase family 36 protein n=1 Tax=Psychromonas ossibalaenae TaxID=444922 RepID=UPI00035FD398|nr:glycoside hydrolase family 36 protein [Psychromonas ossibalaenae]